MMITNMQRFLCETMNQIINHCWINTEEFEVNSYFEYDYNHNIEIRVKSKYIDSELTLSFDREMFLKDYIVRGREEDADVFKVFLDVIQYSERTFMNTKFYLKKRISELNDVKNVGV